jgi:hypothetical protein
MSGREVARVREPGSGARLVEFKPWPYENAHLIGHVTVDFSGWVVHRIPVFRKGDGTLSVGVPNAPEVDTEGRQRLRDGKRAYWALITFSGDGKARWERSVLAALDAGGFAP